MNEKILLSSLEDPFLVNLYESYQDRSNLYLILDFLPGGDLRHHLSKKKFN
jgi:serine/threonine protein kinase